MVLKLFPTDVCAFHEFENDVKMYGTQTISEATSMKSSFENDVKMYGTQTCHCGRQDDNNV